MKTPRILLWLAAGVLAVLVGVSSVVIANQIKNPSLSAAIAIGPMGQAEASLAFTSYTMRRARDPKIAVSARERSLASAAYQKEPLSSAALGILILSTDRADGARRQALLDLGGRLTRRSSLITMNTIEAAALRDDYKSFFAWLSRLVSTNERLRRTYIEAMVEATARNDSVAALTPILGAAPEWSTYYWQRVVLRAPSLSNAVKVRVAITRKPWRQTVIKPSDRSLARALAAAGKLDVLARLGEGLGQPPGSSRNSGNLLVNGDFARQPVLAPIDWQLAALGNLGASIDTRGGNLAISAVGGARGLAARQLLYLAPGRYAFGWTLADNSDHDQHPLSARIFCADRTQAKNDPAPIVLSRGTRKEAITITGSACGWHWLDILISVPDDSFGIDARLSKLSLTRTEND